MRLLLDTHVFLRWMADDPRLGSLERAAIHAGDNEVYLSAASVWELAIKQGLGRLRLPGAVSGVVERLGIRPLPVAFAHAEATADLPALHRDPFDRLLVAQAQVESLTLVTRDAAIRAYPGVALLPPT